MEIQIIPPCVWLSFLKSDSHLVTTTAAIAVVVAVVTADRAAALVIPIPLAPTPVSPPLPLQLLTHVISAYLNAKDTGKTLLLVRQDALTLSALVSMVPLLHTRVRFLV